MKFFTRLSLILLTLQLSIGSA
ncbi:MAG: hypothetical protein JWO03_186, partial [Bacteroidetes bacterium]|nr:hypothetical protein [Bacteroidota bacterium]